jgi:DNA-binding NtrC family response regulator
MRLLIIGSLSGQFGEASKIALAHGAKVFKADTVDSALQSLRAGRGADLAMVDVMEDIARLIASLKTERINLPVVACGVGAQADKAVAAIRAGAKEYVPLPPQADLIAAVLEAVAHDSHQLVYRDPTMAAIIKLAAQVASSNASILITGESGTGKELLARYLHEKSPRANKNFVTVNCAAIPDTLLESELFGHEKGAFTGAIARRIGKFEEANGGTLLLDEISEMDVRLQTKLLRAIQEREIDRIGGNRPIKVDIRVIATSNRDLAQEAAKGRFREDLLFRLNVVNLKIPPLRERPADIELLAEHFVRKYSELNGVAVRPLTPAALVELKLCPWKGNVRELENTIHRAVLLATGDVIDVEAIRAPDGSRPNQGLLDAPADRGRLVGAALHPAFVGRTVADVERELIIDTLKSCLGNRTHAANILGISIRTLRNKLKQYNDEGAAVAQPGEEQRAAL